MGIDKISAVSPKWYGAAKSSSPTAPKGHAAVNDTINISSSAQDRFNEKRIETVRARLESHFQDGNIAPKILDKISEKIAAELGNSSQSPHS